MLIPEDEKTVKQKNAALPEKEGPQALVKDVR